MLYMFQFLNIGKTYFLNSWSFDFVRKLKLSFYVFA